MDNSGLEPDDHRTLEPGNGIQPVRRVVLAAGGTAGHVYPALAIASAYQCAVGSLEVMFLGTAEGFEARLVPRNGFPFSVVPCSPMVGRNLLGKAMTAGNLGGAIHRARRLLRSVRAELVIGLGGYPSVPVLIAARSLGLRTAIHECNAAPGMANKLLGRIVDRVYLGFEAATAQFRTERTLVTGNPVRADVAALAGEKRNPPGRGRPARIFVTGGSQGSAFLNREAPALLERLSKHDLMLEVRHQAGANEVESVRDAYRKAGLHAVVTPFVDDIAGAYRWADFAVSCAGAATLSELAIVALPALLVPLASAARNHQASNAAAFASLAGTCWIDEEAWRPEAVAAGIATLLSDQGQWLEASARLRRAAKPYAGRSLVEDCETHMRPL
jgi:UDP-N-acetylglucosamine--N-acetylmuramyl-(pentapeptide) pyrophosphoryl-undecaprenol N-acetylglucosamine transferase